MQHHKDQTDQLKETNRNKCKGGIKNKDTDIQKIYDKNIVEAVAKNTYILNEYIWKRLKHSNERFKIEVKRHEKIEIENLKKYEQHIGEIEQKVHIDNQEAVNKVTEEANKHHKEKVQELQIKHDVIVRKLQSENKALKKKLEYRPFLELQTYISKAKKLKDENQILKGKIKTLEEKQFELEKETIRLQQMEEEIKNLHKTVDKLEKESCMLNATVDEKVAENLTLEKANADLKSRMKKKENGRFKKSIENLQLKNDELRQELIDKHLLIDQAQKTLSSLETNVRFQKKEADNFNQDQDFAEKDSIPEERNGRLRKDSKRTTKVKNTYNFFGSSASFHNNCLVETIAAHGNTNPSITNG